MKYRYRVRLTGRIERPDFNLPAIEYVNEPLNWHKTEKSALDGFRVFVRFREKAGFTITVKEYHIEKVEV